VLVAAVGNHWPNVLGLATGGSFLYFANSVASFLVGEKVDVYYQYRVVSWLPAIVGEARAEEVLGDLDEVYLKDRSQRGAAYAGRRYTLALSELIGRRLLRAAVRLVF
jgi:hypothetical protein